MKRILVPVDFSGHTGITCRYAVEFARLYDAEIRLFHTYFDQILLADTSFPDTLDLSTVYSEGLMKEILGHAERRMKELREHTQKIILEEGLGNITLSSQVTGGELEHELKGLCQEFHPDLVVMGTAGSGRTLNTWGKVSSFIIDHARVPVITVPEIRQFRGFGNVMYTADLSPGNAGVIEGLIALLSDYRAKIHVVHFITRIRQTDEYLRMRTLQMNFRDAEAKGLVRFEIVEVQEDNQAAIDRFVTDHQIDLIAFQPQKHNMLYMMFTRNITRKNLFATRVPLLSMPATP